ncbi:hypothetical protein Nepgr_031247 [Nepenthes gracilis]|uniref:Glycosyltransferase n=1 Tax=Nepenthes gracilis TaxID=150966 RepID=A0AAD3THY4_NEPGR|nr:hypothetical protein Nepgr_031247 [Nepenthes gracilis]
MDIYPRHQNRRHLPQVAVIMVPLPLQGHLNQLLHLSHLIAANQIPVYYVSSGSHIRQAKHRLHGWDPQTSAKIHFHHFQLPEFHSPPPTPNAENNFPAHLQSLIDASSVLRQPVSQLLAELSPRFRRIIIIHDSLMGSVVQDVKSISNAESYGFHTSSAFTLFFFLLEMLEIPFLLDSDIPESVPSNEGCYTSAFAEFMEKQYKFCNLDSGRLYNTSRVIEGRYMDLLEKLPLNSGKKLHAIGPLNPHVITTRSIKCEGRCLEWLDRQGKDSVIYVSFGTTTSMNDEQIKELAIGLQNSEQKFIWAFRDADKSDQFTSEGGEAAAEAERRDRLPEGYEKAVEERGVVVKGWAPQVEILGHPSTGGFLSHCGWNSCMESLSLGVPIAAWPMHSDQPKNTVLVTEVLKVGIVVKDWSCRNEVITALMVENAVRRLMASKEGDVMRERAKNLGIALRKSASEGGTSGLEMDSFIAHITR